MEPIPTEIVDQVSSEEQRQVLENYFHLFYHLISEGRFIPGAIFEDVGGMLRCLSGIPVPYHNAVFGRPEQSKWDESIQKQLSYFNEAKMPFVWYLDEESGKPSGDLPKSADTKRRSHRSC